MEQYRRDRDPRELIFVFGRCIVHFAVDDSEVRMCSELEGKPSWFFPFNRGWNDGAGNPPNPYGENGLPLERVLSPYGLTNSLENYAQIVAVKDPRTGRKKSYQIFPRYHQQDVVRNAGACATHGVGRAISLSTPPASESPTPSPGWPTNSSASSWTNGRFRLRHRGDPPPHPRRHCAQGCRRRGLPERQGEHPHTARMAHDQALGKVMQLLLKDNTQVYKQFVEKGHSSALSPIWCMR